MVALVVGCEKSDGLPPTVHIKASEVDGGTPSAQLPQTGLLTWPADFNLWRDAPISQASDLPRCPSTWYTRRLDEEYAFWKCSEFPQTTFGPGELIVHTRNDKAFVVTTNVACAEAATCKDQRTKLQEVNKDRNVPVPAAHARAFANVWSLGTYRVALAAADLAFSVVYFADLKDLDTLKALIDRGANPPKLNKDYDLNGLKYKLTAIDMRDEVGRGRDRWTARKDSVFVVVEYEIENRQKAVIQDDPAAFSLVARNQVYRPDPKAEEHHFKSDRTGLLITPIAYKSRKPRAHVFEVKREDMARAGLLVVEREGEKLVYPMN